MWQLNAYHERQRRRCRRRCAVAVVVVIAVMVACVLAVVLRRRNLKDDPKMPEYTFLNAVLWPNATVRDKVLITADFTFTLKAHNLNQKQTIFYDDPDTAEVSITRAAKQQAIASSTSASIGPSSPLPPGNYSDIITINIRAQNASFSFPCDDHNDEDEVYDLYLRMRFRVGFKEGSRYDADVLVSCFYIRCNFPKYCTLADPRCHSDKLYSV